MLGGGGGGGAFTRVEGPELLGNLLRRQLGEGVVEVGMMMRKIVGEELGSLSRVNREQLMEDIQNRLTALLTGVGVE